MAMGGYSLGQMDPMLMQQISAMVPESPYAAMARQDPSFAPAAAGYMQRLGSPSMTDPDAAHGVGQPLLSDHGDSGPSAMEVIGGVVSAPFRALGFVKTGLEDALGHRNSRARSAEDMQIEIATKLGLISDALRPDQKAAIWPEQYAQDRAAYDGRSYSAEDGAHGVNTNGMPLPTPRKAGFMDWLTGETQRQRNRQLAQAAMVQHAIEQNIKAEELRSLQAQTGQRYMSTWAEEQRGLGEWQQNDVYSRFGEKQAAANLNSTLMNIEQGAAQRDYSRAAAGNLGADNARADAAEQRAQEAARRDAVADRLGLRNAREQGRHLKLQNRGLQLGLRDREALGPFGDDTGYDKLGRAFKLSQFTTKLNTAQDDTERANVLNSWNVPTRETGGILGYGTTTEPDYDAMRFRPEPAGEAQDTRPQTSVAPADLGRVDAIFSHLARSLPSNSTRHADLRALATKLASASDERSFYQIAKAAGLSKEQGVALWRGE